MFLSFLLFLCIFTLKSSEQIWIVGGREPKNARVPVRQDMSAILSTPAPRRASCSVCRRSVWVVVVLLFFIKVDSFKPTSVDSFEQTRGKMHRLRPRHHPSTAAASEWRRLSTHGRVAMAMFVRRLVDLTSPSLTTRRRYVGLFPNRRHHIRAYDPGPSVSEPTLRDDRSLFFFSFCRNQRNKSYDKRLLTSMRPNRALEEIKQLFLFVFQRLVHLFPFPGFELNGGDIFFSAAPPPETETESTVARQRQTG